MRMKQREFEGKKFEGKPFDFAKAALLSASIFASSCGGAVHQARTPPPQHQVQEVRPIEVRCMGRTQTIGAGQELSIGITSRSSYAFRIKSLGPDSVNADVSVPVMIREGPNLFTLSVRFNDVVFRRRNLDDSIRRICSRFEDMIRPRSTPVNLVNFTATGNTTGLEPILARMLGAGSLSSAIGSVSSLRDGSVDDEYPAFRVLGSSEAAFHLRIEDGRFRGQVLTLDRKLDFSVDRFEEPEGYLEMPLRISDINTGRDSVGITIETDCSRRMSVDFPSMGEYHGINPACK